MKNVPASQINAPVLVPTCIAERLGGSDTNEQLEEEQPGEDQPPPRKRRQTNNRRQQQNFHWEKEVLQPENFPSLDLVKNGAIWLRDSCARSGLFALLRTFIKGLKEPLGMKPPLSFTRKLPNISTYIRATSHPSHDNESLNKFMTEVNKLCIETELLLTLRC
ncbi:uncharacterized protein LOC113472274 [Diaphorina citri]|uniref:Uncharacterized protein LOC113472274 n=1 Tax=Diaphorina citri TaxID=121845 RepID=A0A3Q0JH31_DIACI|nr:uncharacterized protein LOC113472274 [Diaphorina citri]